MTCKKALMSYGNNEGLDQNEYTCNVIRACLVTVCTDSESGQMKVQIRPYECAS